MLLFARAEAAGMKNRIARFLNYRKRLSARENKSVGYQSVGGFSGKRGKVRAGL